MTNERKVSGKAARLAALRETVEGLERHGLLDKKTLRELNLAALTPVEPMSGPDIAALRDREGVSQAVLARHLNVGTKLVSDWECGLKRPSGPSLKLLSIAKARGLGAIA